MVLTVSADPLGARFSLAPFDEWLAAFHINRNRYQIEAQYYPGGIPHTQQSRRHFERPAAGVRTILDGSSDEASSSHPDGTPSIPIQLLGSPHSSPPKELNPDIANTGSTQVALDRVPDTVGQLMTWIDPGHDFTSFPVPPLRSPAAHTKLQEMDADHETHARTVIERLSPPVEALVPLETGHRVLAVEPITEVESHGDPTDTETWDRYRDRLRPGECLGIHLTHAPTRE